MDWKRKIEIESCLIAMKELIVLFPRDRNLSFHESMNEYIKTFEDNDRNNTLILAVRKAIDLTEKRFKNINGDK